MQEQQRAKEAEERDTDVPPMDLDDNSAVAEQSAAMPITQQMHEEVASHRQTPEIKVKIEGEADALTGAGKAALKKYQTPHHTVVPPNQSIRAASPLPQVPERRVTRSLARSRSLSVSDVSAPPLAMKGGQSKLSQQLVVKDEDVKTDTKAKKNVQRARSGTPVVKVEEEDDDEAPFEPSYHLARLLPAHLRHGRRSPTIVEEPTQAQTGEPSFQPSYHSAKLLPALLRQARRSPTIVEEPTQAQAGQEDTNVTQSAVDESKPAEATAVKLEDKQEKEKETQEVHSPVKRPILASPPSSPVTARAPPPSSATDDILNEDKVPKMDLPPKPARTEPPEEFEGKKSGKLFAPRSASSDEVQVPKPLARNEDRSMTAFAIEDLLLRPKITISASGKQGDDLGESPEKRTEEVETRSKDDSGFSSDPVPHGQDPACVSDKPEMAQKQDVPQAKNATIDNDNEQEELTFLPTRDADAIRGPIRYPSTSPSYADETEDVDDEFFEDSYGAQVGHAAKYTSIKPVANSSAESTNPHTVSNGSAATGSSNLKASTANHEKSFAVNKAFGYAIDKTLHQTPVSEDGKPEAGYIDPNYTRGPRDVQPQPQPQLQPQLAAARSHPAHSSYQSDLQDNNTQSNQAKHTRSSDPAAQQFGNSSEQAQEDVHAASKRGPLHYENAPVKPHWQPNIPAQYGSFSSVSEAGRTGPAALASRIAPAPPLTATASSAPHNVPWWLQQAFTQSTDAGYAGHHLPMYQPMQMYNGQTFTPWPSAPSANEMQPAPPFNQQVYQMTCPRCQECGSLAIESVQYYGTCDVGSPPPAQSMPHQGQQQRALKQMPAKVAHDQLPHEQSKSSSEASVEEDDGSTDQPPLASRVAAPTVQQLRQNYTFANLTAAGSSNKASSLVHPPAARSAPKNNQSEVSSKAGLQVTSKKSISSDHHNARMIPQKQVKLPLSKAVEDAKKTSLLAKQSKRTASTVRDLPSASRRDKPAPAEAKFWKPEYNRSTSVGQLTVRTSRPPGPAMRAIGIPPANLATSGFLAAAENTGTLTRKQAVAVSGPHRMSDSDKKPKPSKLPLQSGALAVRRVPARQPSPPPEVPRHQVDHAIKRWITNSEAKVDKSQPPAMQSDLVETEEEDDDMGNFHDNEDDEGDQPELSTNIRVKIEPPQRRQAQAGNPVAKPQARTQISRNKDSTPTATKRNRSQQQQRPAEDERGPAKRVRMSNPLEQPSNYPPNVQTGGRPHLQLQPNNGFASGQQIPAGGGQLKSAMKAKPTQANKAVTNKHVNFAHLNPDESDDSDGRRSPGIVPMPIRPQPPARPPVRKQTVPEQAARPRRATTKQPIYVEQTPLEAYAEDDDDEDTPDISDTQLLAQTLPKYYMPPSNPPERMAGPSAVAGRGKGRGKTPSQFDAQEEDQALGRTVRAPAKTTRSGAANRGQDRWSEEEARVEEEDEFSEPDIPEDFDSDGEATHALQKQAVKTPPKKSQPVKGKGRAASTTIQAPKKATPRRRKATEPLAREDQHDEEEDSDEAEFQPVKTTTRQRKTPAPKTKATPARKPRATKK